MLSEPVKLIMSEVARIGHDYDIGQSLNEIARGIIMKFPAIFTVSDSLGDTPLINAILKGNYPQACQILELLKEQCSLSLNATNPNGHY